MCLHANAQGGDWFQNTNVQGFFSQTAIHTSDNDFLGRTDDRISLDFWEAGLLLDTRVYEKMTFSAQALGREVSDETGIQKRLDFAFLSYPIIQGTNYTLGARVGRIRSSFGFYNETRDIPHARTGIIMPQSIYYDMTRNSFYSADGLEFFAYRDIGDNRLSFQVFYSKPVEEREELKEAADLDPDEFDGDKSILVKLTYGSEFDGFRVGLTYYKPEYDVDVNIVRDFEPEELNNGNAIPGMANPISLELGGKGSSFFSENIVTSVEYNQLDWSVTAEYSRHKFEMDIPVKPGLDILSDAQIGGVSALDALSLLGPAGDAIIQTFVDDFENGVGSASYEEAFYFQGLYRFGEQWEVYSRYDSSQAHTKASIPTIYKWKDYNLGASYRPDESWVLRAEFHYIEGTNRLLSRDNPQDATRDTYWTAALFQVAYRW